MGEIAAYARRTFAGIAICLGKLHVRQGMVSQVGVRAMQEMWLDGDGKNLTTGYSFVVAGWVNALL